MKRIRFLFAQARRLVRRDPRDILRYLFLATSRSPMRLYRRFSPITLAKHENFVDPSAPSIIPESFKPLVESGEISKYGRGIIQSGIISLLGKNISTGWPPKWETEETGVWPKTSSASIQFYGPGFDRDIKLVWELARLQWIPNLAAFAKETNDREVASEVLDIIVDFYSKHPINKGIAWMEGIEVSLRSIAIIEALSHLRGFEMDEPRIAEILTNLSVSAEWINEHLSYKWRLNNNHLLLELIGLTIIGVVSEWHKSSAKWKNNGLRMLSSEIKKQTIAGRNWEPTTSYHKFVTESLLVLIHHLENWNGNQEDKRIILETTEEYLDSLFWMCDSQDRIPLVGDDDAAVVAPRPRENDARDCRTVFSLAGKLGFATDSYRDGVKIWRGHGMATIKTEDWLIHAVSGAPVGKARQGSHRHLDMLSVSVNIAGEDVILDSGTGLYFGSPEWRDYFRKESSHSGIKSSEMEWGKIGDLFEIPKPATGECSEHHGKLIIFANHPSGVKQSREIAIKDNQLIIRDNLQLKGPIISFIFPRKPEISVSNESAQIVGEGWKMTHSGSTFSVEEICGFCSPDNSTPDTGISLISPSYGIFQSSYRVDFLHTQGNLAVTTIKRA